MGRIGVLLVAVIAICLSFAQEQNVLKLVSYAWAGLGAAFGPPVLLSLYWKRMNVYGACAGIIAGATAVILWKNVLGWSDCLYELLSAFVLGVIAIASGEPAHSPPYKEVPEGFGRSHPEGE